MKKIKNLKISIADHFIFFIYFAALFGGTISFNEIYQSNLAKMLASKLKIAEDKAPKKILVKRDLYKVHMISGEVKVVDTESKAVLTTKLAIEMIIESGKTIVTGDKSLLILKFGENEKSFLKIGSNSEVVLKYSMENSKERSTDGIYNQITELVLEYGNILFDIKDKYKENSFKIKSKAAVMGVRGTVFLASIDKTNKFAIGVEEGAVEMQNNINLKKKTVKAGEGFMILPDGFELSLNILKLLPNWNIFDVTKPILDKEAFKEIKKKEEKKEEIKPVVKQKEIKVDPYLEKVAFLADRMKILMNNFFNELQSLKEKRIKLTKNIKILSKDIKTIKKELEEEKVYIEQDLSCLQSKKKRCQLNKKKLLMDRGYPKIIFSSKGRKGMFDELVKYVEEREELVSNKSIELQESKIELKKLEKRIASGDKSYEKLSKLDFKENLRKGIRTFKHASGEIKFRDLKEQAKKVERDLNR